MGHGKVDTTLNVYAQVIDGSKRAAAEKIGGELFTIVHTPEMVSELTHCVNSEHIGDRSSSFLQARAPRVESDDENRADSSHDMAAQGPAAGGSSPGISAAGEADDR